MSNVRLRRGLAGGEKEVEVSTAYKVYALRGGGETLFSFSTLIVLRIV